MAAFLKDGAEQEFVAAADTNVGALVQVAGQVGIVNPTHDGQPVLSGETGVARVRAGTVVMLDNPDGVTATDGDVVGYDAANDKATAAAGGDFDCGSINAALSTSDRLAVALGVGV